MKFKLWGALAVVIGGGILLAHCGIPVCAVGIGDCAKMFGNPPTSAKSTAAGLQINGPTTVSRSAGQQIYQAIGGTGVYTYTVLGSTGCGAFTGTTQNTTIGYFTPAIAGPCTIQATDTSNPPINGVLPITITN